jgi:hypothetical protein
MRRRAAIVRIFCLALGLAVGWSAGWCRATGGRAGSDDDPQPEVKSRSSLWMTKAVVCESIDGYEDYEPLPGAALTSDEKLLVYFRPLGFKSAHVGESYQAHLTQDGEIHRRGEKTILRKKSKLIDYTSDKYPQPVFNLYLRDTISLRGLKPGDYDLIIILHDEVAKGATATQVVKFRVIPAADPKAVQEKEPKGG